MRLIFRETRPPITLRTHAGTPVESPRPQKTPPFNNTEGDGVSWAWWTWNIVTGCLHDCAARSLGHTSTYCYADELAYSERLAPYYPVGFTPLFHTDRLDSPRVTPMPRDAAHGAMRDSPQWQYITLTKNPARYTVKPPPPGAWVGTSVDEQKRVRIAEQTMARVEGAAVRWLSLEPLCEDLRFTDLSMFDWVVIGALTSTQHPDGKRGFVPTPAFAPPFEWVAHIVVHAREAGCRVHLKPNLLGKTSGQSPGMALPDEYPESA
jgi:protein gp37